MQHLLNKDRSSDFNYLNFFYLQNSLRTLGLCILHTVIFILVAKKMLVFAFLGVVEISNLSSHQRSA